MNHEDISCSIAGIQRMITQRNSFMRDVRRAHRDGTAYKTPESLRAIQHKFLNTWRERNKLLAIKAQLITALIMIARQNNYHLITPGHA
jgi:hypothetical protein